MQRTFSKFQEFKIKMSSLFWIIKNYIKPHNVLKIDNLPRGFIDKDYQMFHAMFQILVNFVEKEYPFCDTYQRDPHKIPPIIEMQEFIENKYNSEEGLKHFFWDGISEEDKVKVKLNFKKHYIINSEILYLYSWYKNKKFEFNEKIYLDDNGNPTNITWQEFFELEDEHRMVCNNMLKRILCVREHLWT